MMLVATKAFTYANVMLQPGDTFRADSAEDARLLVGFDKAIKAESIDAKQEEPKQGRRYKRRDMHSED